MRLSSPRRVRAERRTTASGTGKYAVCWGQVGRLRFRTVGFDLVEARREPATGLRISDMLGLVWTTSPHSRGVQAISRLELAGSETGEL